MLYVFVGIAVLLVAFAIAMFLGDEIYDKTHKIVDKFFEIKKENDKNG